LFIVVMVLVCRGGNIHGIAYGDIIMILFCVKGQV